MQAQSNQDTKMFLRMVTDRMQFHSFEASRRRVSLHLDRQDVAKQLKISPDEYARIEQGAAYPSFEQAIRIADILQMLPSELIWIGPPIGIWEE